MTAGNAALTGRTALVTGGTRGIGRELVAELARRGATVHFCGRDERAVDRVSADVDGAVGHVADLAVAAERRALADAVVAAGGLDILVNNAGIGRVLSVMSTPPADPGAEIQVNLIAPIDLTFRLLPHLRGRRHPSIVNVGSALAYVPMAAEPVYCASKAGLHSWSQSLRHQLDGQDIEVIEALLPTVDTDMASVFDVTKITAADAAKKIVDTVGRGDRELRIGQGRALYVMSRLVPRFIFAKLNETPIGPRRAGKEPRPMSTPDEAYNYDTFRPAAYIQRSGSGPSSGTDLGDHIVHCADGTRTTLGELVDRPTVVETGSTTCPLYCANVSRMKDVASRHAEVDFLMLYTREAHPGGRQGPHTDLDQKLAAASTLPSAVGESRTVVVDELDGRLHRLLGAGPNSLVVLDERACIVTSMGDADPVALERVLTGLAAGDLPDSTPRFRLPFPAVAVRALLRGGAGAVWDFMIGLPALARYRLGARFRPGV